MNRIKIAMIFLIITIIMCFVWAFIVVSDAIPGETRLKITLYLGVAILVFFIITAVIYLIESKQ